MCDANFDLVYAIEKLNRHDRQRVRRPPLSVVVSGKNNPLVGFHIRVDAADADACPIASLQPCAPGTARARIKLAPVYGPGFRPKPTNESDRVGPRLEQERS